MSKLADVCRLCLKTGKIMYPLFTGPNDKRNPNLLVEKITSIARIEISPDDDLPTLICESCQREVEKFHEFKRLIELSDRNLRVCLLTNVQAFSNLEKNVNNRSLSISPVPRPFQNKQIIETKKNSKPSLEDLKEYEDDIVMIQTSSPESDFICQLCFKSFQSLKDLKNHVLKYCIKEIDTNTTQDITETECEIMSDSEIQEGKLIIDEKIPKKTKRKTRKSKTTNSKAKYKCQYCNKSILKTNKTEHTKKCSLKQTNLTCEECGKKFQKRSQLTYHKGIHVKLSMTCEYCSKQFGHFQSFKVHLKRHILSNRHKCNKCNKSYFSTSDLRRHIQTHSEHKNYRCPVCSTEFASQSEVNRHKRYHSATKPFKCKRCPKSYYESGHLKIHELTHTGVRPYVCQFCEKGFVTRFKMTRHMKIHQKES